MDEGREFRMNDGFGFGVHTADGRSGVLIAGCEFYELGPRDEACLHMAGIYFLDRLKELNPPPELETIRLTPRERDCLSWVAAGKSDWEISVILGISENTARGYVQQAMEKLQVSNRPHAVAVGLLRKVINV
jgi:LuxR family transcriptional regulator, quorum-sensing system regulator BjaR1